MGYGADKNKVIEKSVTETQNYTASFKGDRKRWVDIDYRFFGEDWEKFSIILAENGYEIWSLTYFMGAQLFLPLQKIVMCNSFSQKFWLEKYAQYLPRWTFGSAPKRFKIPQVSKDEDSLNFIVNGRDASDIWSDSFNARQNSDEAA